MRRLTAPLAFCLVLALTSCIGITETVPVSSRSNEAPTATWSIAGASALATLDPIQATDAASIAACSLVYEGLVDMNGRLHVVPAAATSWSRSSNGIYYTFHLRRDLRFSNGTRITPWDVVQSFRRAVASSGTNGIMGGYLQEIASTPSGPAITSHNPDTVTFRLRYPSPPFLLSSHLLALTLRT